MPETGKHIWKKLPHVRTGKQLSAGERAADFLKKWFGTWTALGLVGVAIAVWILAQKTAYHWDLYPFILLNLCLSCLAAVQGIILQISANRGDRISSEVATGTHDAAMKLLGLNETQLEILTRLDGIGVQIGQLARASALAAAVDQLAGLGAIISEGHEVAGEQLAKIGRQVDETATAVPGLAELVRDALGASHHQLAELVGEVRQAAEQALTAARAASQPAPAEPPAAPAPAAAPAAKTARPPRRRPAAK